MRTLDAYADTFETARTSDARFRLGLVVNHLAGLGGRVGLKGSDGLAALALSKGAVPEAMARAARAIAVLRPDRVRVVTGAGDLGAASCRLAGHAPTILAEGPRTGDEDDTVRLVAALRDAGVELLLFAGGDGTARLVAAHAGDVPILGIPAGVKMYSGVFSRSAAAAGFDVRDHIEAGPAGRVFRDVDLLDIDEAAWRDGRARPRLVASARAPATTRLQGAKASPPSRPDADLEALAHVIAEECRSSDDLWIFGPGTGTSAIVSAMGLRATPVGVDAVRHGTMVARDASEADLVALLAEGSSPRVVVGVLGGLGAIFGRGNQQIAPALLRRAGRGRIMLVASSGKLAGLPHLFLDTGDEALDAEFAGHWRVRTAPRREMVLRVVADGA